MCSDVMWQTYIGSFYGKYVLTTVMIKRPKLFTSIRISGHSDGKSAAIERNISLDRIVLVGILIGWYVDCKGRKRILNDGSLAGVFYINS